MKKIYLFEPSIGSENVGDQIIIDSIKKEMCELFAPSFCIELPTHTPLSNRYMYFLGKPDYRFILGSNIIVGDLNQFIHLKQWCLSPLTLHNVKNAILIGVGAQQYGQKIRYLTKLSYRLLFNKSYIHSVRDSYTEKNLKSIGILNVLNTGCPTMWSLSSAHCKLIPCHKAEEVVFTLTDYKPNIERDSLLIKTLKENYLKISFWPQGHRDFDYFKSLSNTDDINVINPNLKDYDYFLNTHDVDFVGTRLHGGIRALQHKRRSLIIGVDNRAVELNKDFNLPVLKQENISDLSALINTTWHTDIRLPVQNIKKFLLQFKINYNG